MKKIVLLFSILLAPFLYGQINTVTIGNSYSDYIKILDVFNTTNATAVKLEFFPKITTSGTLHAPSGKSPYVITDKKGNRYALKYQVGWYGPDTGGFGSESLKAYEKKVVTLYFNKVNNVSDIYSLTEVDCDGTNCWNFYDIKVKKKTNNLVNTSNSSDLDRSNVSASYDRTWLEMDVYDSNNRFGIRIHNKYGVSGFKDNSCYLTIRIMEGDNFVKTSKFGYKNSSGQIELKMTITPKYESTTFNDTNFFLPYELLSTALPMGKHNLKIDVDLFYMDGPLLKHLGFKEFTYTKR